MHHATVGIDVGFGNTKYCFRRQGENITDMFPSLTPSKSANDLNQYSSLGIGSKRATAMVRVDGHWFEVGPGNFTTSAYGDSGRFLVDDFAVSNRYRALIGAVFTLNQITSIDTLVLGLPVETIQKYSDQVSNAFRGMLDFGHGQVSVNRVAVVPQPTGSLLFASRRLGAQFTASSTNIIVDVGYYTTDWVVARGFDVDPRRSGGVRDGASDVYKSIAEQLTNALKVQIRDIERIDEAVRSSKPLSVNGRDVDLAPFLRNCLPKIQSTIAQLRTKIGNADDASRILLTGGGAPLFEASLRDAYKESIVEVVPGPCFSNAIGFLIYGEMLAERLNSMGARNG
jgi:plasmid segregation protein ParM